MLNDAKLRGAKPRAKAYKLTDSHRLYLLVKPNGGKLWRWNYSYDGKQKSMNFGIYPMVSLLDARAKRDEAYASLCEGRDPAIVKKLKIEENLEAARQTFQKLARAWHGNVKSQWARRHAEDVLRSLEREVFPSIGSLPISQITPPLVLGVLREISAVFVYGIAAGVTKDDPAEKLGAVLKPLRKGKQPAITDLNRLQRMILDAEEDYARPITRLALRLLALTAVRPNELRGAHWAEFEDLDGPQPLWRIPTARMKGDLDRKEELGGDHLVPLAPQAVDVLRAVWPLTGGGDLVFPSSRHAHRPMSENAIGYLLNRAGYHGHHVPHGFRAAFSTIMNEWAERNGKELDRQIIELMLAHVLPGKVEGAYNRAAYMPRRRERARGWGGKLCGRLPEPGVLIMRPVKAIGSRSRRSFAAPVDGDFKFPSLGRAA